MDGREEEIREAGKKGVRNGRWGGGVRKERWREGERERRGGREEERGRREREERWVEGGRERMERLRREGERERRDGGREGDRGRVYRLIKLLFHPQDLDEDEMLELTESAISMSDDLEFKDDGYIELVLRVLGLMCDNQHKGLQVNRQMPNVGD